MQHVAGYLGQTLSKPTTGEKPVSLTHTLHGFVHDRPYLTVIMIFPLDGVGHLEKTG